MPSRTFPVKWVKKKMAAKGSGVNPMPPLPKLFWISCSERNNNLLDVLFLRLTLRIANINY